MTFKIIEITKNRKHKRGVLSSNFIWTFYAVVYTLSDRGDVGFLKIWTGQELQKVIRNKSTWRFCIFIILQLIRMKSLMTLSSQFGSVLFYYTSRNRCEINWWIDFVGKFSILTIKHWIKKCAQPICFRFLMFFYI